jgi:hypothetical protein
LRLRRGRGGHRGRFDLDLLLHGRSAAAGTVGWWCWGHVLLRVRGEGV